MSHAAPRGRAAAADRVVDLHPPPKPSRRSGLGKGYIPFQEKHVDAMLLALRREAEWRAGVRPPGAWRQRPPQVSVRLVAPGESVVSACNLVSVDPSRPSVVAVQRRSQQLALIDIRNEAAVAGGASPPTIAWAMSQVASNMGRLQPGGGAAGAGASSDGDDGESSDGDDGESSDGDAGDAGDARLPPAPAPRPAPPAAVLQPAAPAAVVRLHPADAKVAATGYTPFLADETAPPRATGRPPSPPPQQPPANPPTRARSRERSPPPSAARRAAAAPPHAAAALASIWDAVAAPLSAPPVNPMTSAALGTALTDGDASTAAALVGAVQGQLHAAALLLASARGPLDRLASELQGRTDG